MLATDNSKVPSLSSDSYYNCNNTTVPHCFHFRHSSLIITLYCTYQVDSPGFTLYWATVLQTKRALGIKFLYYQLPMQPQLGFGQKSNGRSVSTGIFGITSGGGPFISFGIFRPKLAVPFLTSGFFALIGEFGKGIKSDKSHFYCLARFNRKMSPH